jgi:hypothetical protein
MKDPNVHRSGVVATDALAGLEALQTQEERQLAHLLAFIKEIADGKHPKRAAIIHAKSLLRRFGAGLPETAHKQVSQAEEPRALGGWPDGSPAPGVEMNTCVNVGDCPDIVTCGKTGACLRLPLQHPSTRPRDVDAVRRETWVGPTGKQVHGLVNRNPAPDAAAPAMMSETTTIRFGGGPVGYAREVAGMGSCATGQECEWQPWCRMHANCRKKIEAARTAKNNASAPDGGKSA